ncbi:conserved hypothetical protein [Burkholderia pseudomallei Pakistan 9]|nr:conserved hypothetical protein [Burkholderia pseudomallei Pakistan 9]
MRIILNYNYAAHRARINKSNNSQQNKFKPTQTTIDKQSH